MSRASFGYPWTPCTVPTRTSHSDDIANGSLLRLHFLMLSLMSGRWVRKACRARGRGRLSRQGLGRVGQGMDEGRIQAESAPGKATISDLRSKEGTISANWVPSESFPVLSANVEQWHAMAVPFVPGRHLLHTASVSYSACHGL